MYALNELKPKFGSKKRKKRVARGESSGHGKTATRGSKGQQSRTGGGSYAGFEGGQTPLYRRMPKTRGFNNFFRVEYEVVNVSQLNEVAENEVTLETLAKAGIISRRAKWLKVLGDGEITKAISIKAHAISETAKQKLEKAGGKIELLEVK
jgi:large subunit ribosomal protein L15